MKRMLISVVAFSFANFATTAQAQVTTTTTPTNGTGVMELGIHAGGSVPTGDLGDGFDTGFRIGAHLGFQPWTLPIGLRAEVGYDRLSGASFGDGGFEVEVDDASIWSGALNGVYRFVMQGSTLRPYVTAGLGVYHLRGGEGTLEVNGGQIDESGSSETKFGLNGGGGVAFQLSGLNTFVEVRWVNVFTEGSSSSYIPVVVGLSFALPRSTSTP